MIGETLGQYKIEALLGAGGMGTVYRARDAKLGRDVAIKVLSPEFAGDAERLARFEREARLLASLNHPNVATLHGLESTGELSFLVMELVEGETLAEALARGPLPIEEALSLFRQIAAGLEAAHGKGVVHRDLKPANIMITPDGDVKILDFGLAKALAVEDDAGDDISRSPTLTRGTALGVIMGTAPYMSPEQARGRVVDKRTDIWAFGCCLYESLTGGRPFDGDTVTDILAAVVKNEPEWNRLPADTPPSVTRALRRCLEKDRRRRLRDIGDAGMDLEASVESDATPSSVRKLIMITIGVAVVSALVSGVVVWSLSSSSEAPTSDNGALVKCATVKLAAPLALSETVPVGVARSVVALSRDGNHLVYVALQNGETQLYHRSLSELGARPISGTEGGFAPFFSPDGQSVCFFTADRLKKVSLLGGEPSTLCEARNSDNGSWGDDDFIIFTSEEGLNVSRVPASGGQPEILLRSDPSRGEELFAQLQLLPGGTHALVSMNLGRATQTTFRSSRSRSRMMSGALLSKGLRPPSQPRVT